MVPPCSDRISRVPPYSRTSARCYPYGAITLFGLPFQVIPVPLAKATGLVRVRSSLLAESRLMSFPPGTEMFQFPGFASFRMTLRSGFPIRKSTDQSLFAAPRGLSQRITSFIASQRQGIHQMPFETLDRPYTKADTGTTRFCLVELPQRSCTHASLLGINTQ